MKRGDVVEVEWPYSDQTGSKIRPAVVAQVDFLNPLIDDTILIQITGTRHGLPGTEVILDSAQEPDAHLSKVCVVACTNILTFDQALIRRAVGFLSDAAMRQIEACVKKVLEIP